MLLTVDNLMDATVFMEEVIRRIVLFDFSINDKEEFLRFLFLFFFMIYATKKSFILSSSSAYWPRNFIN